jgi:hypothetical protein
MKKVAKKSLWVLIVTLLMISSTLGFILFNVPTTKQNQNKNLTQKFLFDETIPEDIRQYYYARGITIMEFYCTAECPSNLLNYVEKLPSKLGYQLAIEKHLNSNETYIVANSVFGSVEKNVTTEQDIDDALCDVLYKPPVECGLRNASL